MIDVANRIDVNVGFSRLDPCRERTGTMNVGLDNEGVQENRQERHQRHGSARRGSANSK
jgi:hypothetical protein